MRPGEPGDRDPLAALVRRRAEWMRDHGHHRWRGLADAADHHGQQVAEPGTDVWVLVDTDGVILGCTTASTDTPTLGWTEQERADPATFLLSTITDPIRAGQGVGMVIAFWALDHAARQGHHWVRRGVLTDDQGANRGLIRYYRRQGWRVVRAVAHPRRADITVWSLARPAERQPLDAVFGEGDLRAAAESAWVEVDNAALEPTSARQVTLPVRAHEMGIYKRYFDLIATGRKTTEIRVNDSSRKKIKAGSLIRFRCQGDEVLTRVTRVARYTSFDEMFDHEAVSSVNPLATREDQLANIRQIYPPEREALGVVAIGIELVDPPRSA
ncbi:MAG TPA: ASCH domain-containing protein [Actinokineospora sp.]|jgi:ASC-1-like (ASCH) protein/GNAT superfamily N-acetyltransferase|nr:ASCH domain-containing protein [Actinokineospora sp.]